MKDKFNKYCAEVIGYSIKPSAKESNSESSLFCTKEAKDDTDFERFFSKIGFWYRPYDDLNQRMPVFDKLFTDKLYGGNHQSFNWQIYCYGIDKATKDFIISTMDKE